MAIEITGQTSTPVSNNKETVALDKLVANNDSSQNQTTKTPSSSDTVTITSKAELLRQLDISVNEQSVVDNERVEELRIAIDTGTYDIDPLRVAEKLIRFEAELAA